MGWREGKARAPKAWTPGRLAPHSPARSSGTGWQTGMLANPASSPAGLGRPVAGTSATWMGHRPVSHRHAPGSQEQMGRPAGPLALLHTASWLCCACCLGTSGLAGRLTCRLPMDGHLAWAAEGRDPRPPPGFPLKCQGPWPVVI